MHMHARKQRKKNANIHYLFLFILSGSFDHGKILPTFRVGLPTLVKPLWKTFLDYTQGFISQMSLIICVLKLTIKINQHTQNNLEALEIC